MKQFAPIKNAALIGILALGACRTIPPIVQEGNTLKLSHEGAAALQIRDDRSGITKCNLGGNQEVKVGQETYWSPNTGGGGDTLTLSLFELEEIKNTGSCDRMKPIFMDKKVAEEIATKEALAPASQESPFIPIPEGATNVAGFGK